MEIAPGIHSLSQSEGGHIHAFLLDDGTRNLILIDTLWDTDGGHVVEYLRGIDRPVTDLKHIILTHAHRSHLGGLAALKRLSDATVYGHEWEADIIAGDRKAQAVSLIPTRPLLTYLPTYKFQAGLAVGVGKHPPCPVDETVADRDRIGPLHVLHAPGHTPGHLAFYWPERQALFAGDAICTWPTFAAGWPALNLNPRQNLRSIAAMAELDAEIVAVGHGEPITSGGTRRMRELVGGRS